ncbi:hypothetical protein E3N88_13038 [Mikania micrantha]|uniref:Uncharacterized protein n=1 Tax=Mikania micrantha TaxID=192012 RepID=A0A5N6P8I6_9ASTR|nr:hypothetical protein E3N88_13038 [Mikania micrantha]
MIRDPLIRYIHHCIVTRISGRGQSQEWVTTTDLFYLHSLIAGRPCNLARCFALYCASFYHRQERGTLWVGAFVTHIVRSRGMVDMLDDLPAIEPRKLDRQTIISMKLAADIPGLGLRFIGQDGRPFQPAQVVVVLDQQLPPGATRRLSRWHASSDGSIVTRIWSSGRSRQSMRNGTRTQLPPFPEPRVYADDGSDAGPSGS